MKKFILFLLSAFPLHFATGAFAASGSATTTCSATTPYGYVYAYAYQYASVYPNNGQIGSESHSFSFSGELSGEEKASPVMGVRDSWIFYRGRKYDFLIPFQKGAGIFIRKGNDPNWTFVCN